ncbi:sugar phosphate isomerase/epimerase [Cesiribacter sp. SM1]|uniref:sugar phosphate isomerase/epimerase family protein n=1 Tax=Cesiribacter sp. SM1 TaxID=2861196 RepID=UPI001CD6B67C|nr:sugar phosphate isomerase/epimerase [Cesiribacter sp. SM1]
MSNNRREFLRLSASLLASGLVLPFISCDSSTNNNQQAAADTTGTAGTTANNGAQIDFGIQLWTVKQDMAQDPKGTLQKLASYGYKQIESFEGDKGIFWGMTNKEFSDYLQSLGMTIISTHANVKENLEMKAQQAAEIGMKYVIDPYEGPQQSLDDFKRMAERFNEYGQICQKHGVKFAYHNHDYTFKEIEGVVPQTLLLEQTDPALVDFELDMYWVAAGGGNIEDSLKKHSGRYKLGHVKDRMKGATEGDASTVIGEGSIDYQPILKVAKNNGMEYFFVEQERFDNDSPMESSRKNAEAMKNFRI